MPKKRKFFAGSPPEKGKQVKSMDATTEMDLKFIQLVRERKYPEALAMMDQVRDINVCDPQTGATALHFAAHRSNAGFIDALEQRDDLDYLIQDREGRYSSELAWEVSGNEELGARLQQKEKEQAERDGVKIWPKPPPFDAQPG